jgi:hypothetical protein
VLLPALLRLPMLPPLLLLLALLLRPLPAAARACVRRGRWTWPPPFELFGRSLRL